MEKKKLQRIQLILSSRAEEQHRQTVNFGKNESAILVHSSVLNTQDDIFRFFPISLECAVGILKKR